MTYEEIINEIKKTKNKQISERELDLKFHKYIQEKYNVSSKVADVIFNYAYEDGHSSGYYDVLNEIEKYSEFALEIMK